MALVVFATVACTDSNGPDLSPTGTWHATRLIVTDHGTPTDALAAGAMIGMTLTSSGTTSGSIHIPAALSESGVEEDLSLRGTWSFGADSTHISFDQAADTFIRDNPWSYDGSTLSYVAAGAGSGDLIEATLTRE
jgi:hypothetical protein